MKLRIRKLIGDFTQLFNIHYSACGRCNRHWGICKRHSTDVVRGVWGCFPLCEDCWQELTPEERLPYYRAHYERGMEGSDPYEDGTWEDMKKAVLEGK